MNKEKLEYALSRLKAVSTLVNKASNDIGEMITRLDQTNEVNAPKELVVDVRIDVGVLAKQLYDIEKQLAMIPLEEDYSIKLGLR